jgi:serine/threonine-protein kinase
MATVWAARKKGAHGAEHIVALKLLSDALQGDDDARAMFLDEARTASRILHPNVVEIYACGEVRQRPYIAMEWIDGDSLAKISSAQKQKGALLPLGWVLHVASAACAGLHAAHEVRDDAGELLNLIHRDVTPQNVMVGFDGTVKVVDFGVAKSRAQTQVSRAGVIKGKTAYFSPEQVLGETIDRRSDLFSMGCLLYLLITGHPPFRGRGLVEVVNQIANRVPQRPLDIMPELHPDLDRIIMRALAKNPNQRYPTAAELRRDIEKVRADLGDPTDSKEVGALVTGLFPTVTEERKVQIASAAADLDRVSSDEPPQSVPRGGTPEDATEVMMRHMALIFAAAPSDSGRTPDPGAARKPDSSARKSELETAPVSARGVGARAGQEAGPKPNPGNAPVGRPGAHDEEQAGGVAPSAAPHRAAPLAARPASRTGALLIVFAAALVLAAAVVAALLARRG